MKWTIKSSEKWGGFICTAWSFSGVLLYFCISLLTHIVKRIDLDLCSVRFERIGCFHDNKEAPRLLPSYLLNDRDENLPNFSGHLIDWKKLVRVSPWSCLPLRKENEGKRLEIVWNSVLGWDIYSICFLTCRGSPDAENWGPVVLL